MPIYAKDLNSLLYSRVVSETNKPGLIHKIYPGADYPIEVIFNNGDIGKFTERGQSVHGSSCGGISLLDSSDTEIVGVKIRQLLFDHDITAEQLISLILEEHC